MATKTFTYLFWITLVILGLILFKWYWRLQMMYNSSILSFYTPDSFAVPENLREDHDRLINQGSVIMKSKKAVIAILVRDQESKLPEIEKKAERVGNMFNDYRIVVVENDSKDDTRAYLLRWTHRNPRVTVLGCGINADKCSMKFPKTEGHHVDRPRIEKMTHLRNIYLDHVKNHLPSWDYLLIWDLDAVGMVYLDGIAHSIGYLEENPDVDIACANGIYRWGVLTLFYDTYATLSKGENFHIDMKTPHDIRKGLWEHQYQRGEPPEEVDSCFSGFTIYRIPSLLPPEVKYDMSPDDNLECEHVRLNKKIQGKKVINPSMINFILLND